MITVSLRVRIPGDSVLCLTNVVLIAIMMNNYQTHTPYVPLNSFQRFFYFPVLPVYKRAISQSQRFSVEPQKSTFSQTQEV